MAPTCTDNPNNIIEDLLSIKTFETISGLLDEDTLDFVVRMLSDNLFDDDIREVVYEILMEALLSQDEVGVDGAGVYESFFTLLDMDKQQQ